MSPADRKAELVRNGQKMVRIARELGVSVSHVSLVVSGFRRNRRVEQAVADAIGKPLDGVFPPMPEKQQAAA